MPDSFWTPFPILIGEASLPVDDLPLGPILTVMFSLAVIISFVLMAARCYKRCPSNRILVKWGVRNRDRTAKTIHGGGELVLPVVQDYAYLSLEPIQIEIPLRGALSAENIRVNVPSVFTVAIGSEPEIVQNAAIRLLGLNQGEISGQASDIIFGQLRQVIASMNIEEINRDREKFLSNIQESLEPELRKVGLVLINVNITDLTDDSGYIEAIGRKAASAAIQQAEIDVAEQQKRGSIGVAKAKQEQAIEVANYEKSREIGTRTAQQEQTVRIAELRKLEEIGTKTAEQEQAIQVAELQKTEQIGVESSQFEQQAQIKQAERDMRIQLADANAQAITGENTSQAVIASSEADLKERASEAYQRGETRKREAEAAVIEAQYRAQAKAALAQAEKVEAEQRAELEARAKAEKARAIVDAEARAETQRLEAQGEADALYAKLEAEARGQYEILAKKADGLKAIVKSCGGSQEAFQLLMLEHIEGLSQTAAQAISNIKFDKVIVWENGGTDGQGATAGFLQNMAKTLPPMLQIMQDIGGVQMPEYFGKMVGQAEPDDEEAHVTTNGATTVPVDPDEHPETT